MTNENMKLWNAVFKTDPLAVKKITGKSYQGSSPKPYWLIEQATKHFGSCGIGWGVDVVSEQYIHCGNEGKDILHSAVVKVWYIHNGVRGEIQQVGGTKAAYTTSTGKYMADEDAAKKSVTDGMVKCLSMIGFAGDIFSGRWDDSKYVQETAVHFEQEKQKSELQQSFDKAVPFINNATKETQFIAVIERFKDTEYHEQIIDLVNSRKKELV